MPVIGMLIPAARGDLLGGLLTGLSGGLLSGLFGVGGGIILLPLLRLVLGLQQHQAQGVTLAALILPSGLPAMVHYHQRGIRVPWRLLGVMTLGFLPAVWAGALFAVHTPEGPLRWSFVAFLILLAAWALFPPGGREVPRGPGGPAAQVPPWKGFAVGFAGGFCSGLFGIGGGVVMIPLLALWLRLPQHQAQLISLVAMVPPIRLPGLLVYVRGKEDFPWLILWGLASGFALGGYLGARLALSLPGVRLRGAFVGLMLLAAGMMIWDG